MRQRTHLHPATARSQRKIVAAHAGAAAAQREAIALTVDEAARLQAAEARLNNGVNEPNSFASKAMALAMKNEHCKKAEDMRAIPVTPEVAKLLQAAEDIVGYSTQAPGSMARHAQSAVDKGALRACACICVT